MASSTLQVGDRFGPFKPDEVLDEAREVALGGVVVEAAVLPQPVLRSPLHADKAGQRATPVELLARALRGSVDVLAYDVAGQAGKAFERQHWFVAGHDNRVGAVGDDPCLFGQVAETVDAARADLVRNFQQAL